MACVGARRAADPLVPGASARGVVFALSPLLTTAPCRAAASSTAWRSSRRTSRRTSRASRSARSVIRASGPLALPCLPCTDAPVPWRRFISAMDGSLPRKPCKTCKNRFHAGCLYKVRRRALPPRAPRLTQVCSGSTAATRRAARSAARRSSSEERWVPQDRRSTRSPITVTVYSTPLSVSSCPWGAGRASLRFYSRVDMLSRWL